MSTCTLAGAGESAPRADPPRMRPQFEIRRIEARREDVESIEAIVRAFYAAVNVAPDAPRQWDRDRTLYAPWIRFVGLYGAGRHEIRTHQELVDDTEPLVARGFREVETHRVVRRYGQMAHVESVYEGELGAERTRFRGINSLELYHDGARWWIASVIWQAETDAFPLPTDCATAHQGGMCAR